MQGPANIGPPVLYCIKVMSSLTTARRLNEIARNQRCLYGLYDIIEMH